MRPATGLLALVLLVSCTDRPLPTAPVRSTAAVAAAPPPSPPVDGRPMIPYDTTSPDVTPAMARVEALVASSLAQVAIPADAFSVAADAVHPDVACGTANWNGARCWVVYTPYANSDATWENPSFLTAGGAATWSTPPGVTNPVVRWPGPGAYNSDPDQAFDPGTGRLVTFYREVSGGFNNILVTSTDDARHWSPPHLAFRESNHDAVSPAVVIDGQRNARMWYVKSGAGCSSSVTQVRMRTAHPVQGQGFEDAAWSAATDVRMAQPGFAIWHMDVIALPGWQGYLALLASHPVGADCASNDLWLAMSSDGITWQIFPVPVMWRGMRAARALGVRTWYRGALRYDPATDSLHIWPSALTNGNRWMVYHAAVPFTGLLRALLATNPADRPTADLLHMTRVPDAIALRMP